MLNQNVGVFIKAVVNTAQSNLNIRLTQNQFPNISFESKYE